MTKNTTPWQDVRAARKFDAATEARIAAGVERMHTEEQAAMSLSDLRRQRDTTQKQLAATLGVDHTTLSRRERSDDPKLSTIRSQIEALGGSLELVAHFDGETIRLGI